MPSSGTTLMENALVKFVLDHLYIFIPLLLTGFLVTLYLLWKSPKETPVKKDNLLEDYKRLGSHRVNIFIFLYLLIWVVMVVIGIFSGFVVPTLVNSVFALIPLLVLIFARRSIRKVQVED
jgi:TRAP-type C4-dicarboxylate transport system permease large subunit